MTQQIVVQDVEGKLVPLEVKPTDLVKDIKTKLHDLKGIDIGTQGLTFGGKLLNDNDTLQDLAIKMNSTLHLTVRAPGGKADGNDP
jgi:hypothetical protein